MKELTIYLNFFMKNWVLILIPAILVCVLGFSFEQSKDKVFKVQSLLEFKQNGSLEQTNLLSTQAVTFLRTENLAYRFNLDQETKLIVYQPSPLSIQVELESTSLDKLKLSQREVVDFIEGRYKVKKIGEDVYETLNPNVYLGSFLGFLIGSFLGIILALIRAYLKNF